MLSFSDDVSLINERSSARMNFRTKPRIKTAIQKAAALSGMEDSVFAMNAAYKQAIQTIRDHERTQLKPVDHQAFFTALDAPAVPTTKLRAAFASYRKAVG